MWEGQCFAENSHHCFCDVLRPLWQDGPATLRTNSGRLKMSDSSWIRLETFSWTKKTPKTSSCLQQTIQTENSIFLLLELPPGFFAGLFRFHWIFVHWEGNVFFTESLLYFMSSQFWNQNTKLWLTVSRKPLNLNLQAVSINVFVWCVSFWTTDVCCIWFYRPSVPVWPTRDMRGLPVCFCRQEPSIS